MTANRRQFLQQLGLGVGGFGFVSLLPGCQKIHGLRFGARGLPRSSPEAAGVSSPGILAFLDAVARSKAEMHSYMLVRHGKVVAEGWWSPYQAPVNHTMYSMSKSFTSTAVGFAVAEGRLSVDDRVVSFFPADLPSEVSEHLKAVRVRDLLSMSVGHAADPTGEMVKSDHWIKSFLAWPVVHPPGTSFVYNSGATYMLSAIVQERTGKKMVDYLTPRLFEPLGIEGVTWETCPRGINVGGWGLNIRTEGLARFGQLYLQNGAWQGRQILPASWVREATSFKIQQPLPSKPGRPNDQNDWLQGYCYQFWRSRHNAFRGDGAFGQYTIVLPDQDAVVAITSETSNMQSLLDLVWEHLLPAMKDKPLAGDPGLHRQLQHRLAALSLEPQRGGARSQVADRVSGKPYELEPNHLGLKRAVFRFAKEAAVVTFSTAEADYPIACGMERWQLGSTALPGTPPRLVSGGAPARGTPSKVASSCTWTAPDTLEIMMRYHETPHHDSVTCTFDGSQVRIAFLNSMAKMSPTPKDSRGMLQGRVA